ncbi:MAG: class I SAM-dependent methyltransferase [Legionellaceae bacterium]|nr:class I SAM-dependent methyltransferase [Legionellaceae bacterium]
MKHPTLTPELYDYLIDKSLREHPVLKELRDETHKLPLFVMQIPPEQAQFMQLLLKMLNSKNVLEIGTFTGYSALAMALALPDNGRVITCDISQEWTSKGLPFWKKAKQEHKIELKLGRALTTMDNLIAEGYEGKFDFIFIDADKTNYVHYYDRALQLIAPNGLIAIDNVFWDGHVIDSSVTDGQTREIRKLNTLIQHDTRVDVSLLPIADGLFLVRKRSD